MVYHWPLPFFLVFRHHFFAARRCSRARVDGQSHLSVGWVYAACVCPSLAAGVLWLMHNWTTPTCERRGVVARDRAPEDEACASTILVTARGKPRELPFTLLAERWMVVALVGGTVGWG